MEPEQQQQPQLHGLVIISLPPPDNPSKGKTITAYTFSDHLPTRSPPPPPPPPAVRRRLRIPLPKRVIVTLLGAVLLLLALWAGLFSEAPLQLLREPTEDGRRKEASSFLLPIYHKSRIRTRGIEMELKLGYSKIDHEVDVHIGKKEKTKGKANSTAVLPLKGNIFPDGSYWSPCVMLAFPRQRIHLFGSTSLMAFYP